MISCSDQIKNNFCSEFTIHGERVNIIVYHMVVVRNETNSKLRTPTFVNKVHINKKNFY